MGSRQNALGVKEDNETYKNLALNYFNSASVKEAKAFVTDGILVFNEATQPTFSQNATVILDNTVLTSGAQYSISQEGVITISNATTNEGETVSYYVIDNGVLTVVNAEFVNVSITGIKVTAVSSEYKRTENVSSKLTFKFTYDNDTVSESYTLNEGNIYSVSVNGNVATVVVKVTVNNVVYSDEVTLTVSEEPSSVSEVLSATVGGEYMLNGVVVGFATTINQNEVILADNNGKFISVVGLGGGKLINGSYYVDGVDVGYEITIPVILKNDGVGANANKLYASYVGGSNTVISVISKNNQVSLPSASEIIDSNEDLALLLSSGNQYKMVTLKGEINFVMDNDYYLYDFWFYDSPATNIDEIAVNGLIPTFSNIATEYTTSKTFGEIVLGNANANSVNFNKPHNVIKEITALYLGGNGTHAQFVLLSDNTVQDATPTLTTKDFVQPKQLIYAVGDELNFEGCKIVYNYDIRSSVTVDVTLDMVKNMPVIETAGNYTITVNDGATDFTFEIQVLASKIKSIEVSTMPTKSTYNHRDTFETLDVAGGQILVTYENGSSEYVDITKEMFNLEESDEWRIGTVNYALYYAGTKFVLPIAYENTALTVSQFLSSTIGETYDVTGIISYPVGTGSAELLLKDKTSNDAVSIIYSGVIGTYTALQLDTSVINLGDEVVVKLMLAKSTATAGGNINKIFGNATDKDTFVNNLMILSSNNEYKFDTSTATTVSSTAELSAFLGARTERPYFEIVKLVGAKYTYYTGRYSLIFFDEITAASGAKYDGAFVTLDRTTTREYMTTAQLNSYFSKSLTKEGVATYSSPATSEYEIYAMFTGGSSQYIMFAVLDTSWFVEPTVTE